MSGKYAVIKNGVVENIIVADADYKIDGCELIEYADQPISIGDKYQDGKFISEESE
ncbi:hypothetical protein PCO82_13575 [Pectobacteriaceae bacterium CE90]|nr:hypothetical protein PCO82_13575 [Pectobacteriaceae bacterium CE90]